MSALDKLKSSLATSATGWGAVINGTLDIRTVTETCNGAALNAIYVKGVRVISNCTDPDCDCMVKVLAEMFPDIRIVRIKAEVQPHG